MGFLNIILGLVLLVFGRKFFWLFIAVTGFLVGIKLVQLILPGLSQGTMLLIGLGAGLTGALLAVYAQKVAFMLAGFLAGFYLAMLAAQSSGTQSSAVVIFFLFGGVAGAALAKWFMNWAIIIFSCLVGAGMIVEFLGLEHQRGGIIFLILVLAGIFLQARLKK